MSTLREMAQYIEEEERVPGRIVAEFTCEVHARWFVQRCLGPGYVVTAGDHRMYAVRQLMPVCLSQLHPLAAV